MAPRRSGRRSVSAYKKNDYIEYQYKGQTVTGKLLKKASSGTADKPVWIVTPTDRRRKNEEIPEKALGKIIDAQEAMNNRGPKLKKGIRADRNRELSQTSSNSDGSVEDADQNSAAAPKRGGNNNGRAGSPTEDNDSTTKADANKKRKSDDSNANSGSDRANKNKNPKTVTFSRQESSNTNTNAPSRKRIKKPKKAKAASTRIGTRSTRRGSGEMIQTLPDLPTRRKKLFKCKKVKKDENVTVVKMLTGTLYLYRGDRPRAEFIRSK